MEVPFAFRGHAPTPLITTAASRSAPAASSSALPGDAGPGPRFELPTAPTTPSAEPVGTPSSR